MPRQIHAVVQDAKHGAKDRGPRCNEQVPRKLRETCSTDCHHASRMKRSFHPFRIPRRAATARMKTHSCAVDEHIVSGQELRSGRTQMRIDEKFEEIGCWNAFMGRNEDHQVMRRHSLPRDCFLKASHHDETGIRLCARRLSGAYRSLSFVRRCIGRIDEQENGGQILP